MSKADCAVFGISQIFLGNKLLKSQPLSNPVHVYFKDNLKRPHVLHLTVSCLFFLKGFKLNMKIENT